MTTTTYGTPARMTAEEAEENEMYEWLLEQRLLHEAGCLSPYRQSMLNANIPGWSAPVSRSEAAYAAMADNDELFAAWALWSEYSEQHSVQAAKRQPSRVRKKRSGKTRRRR